MKMKKFSLICLVLLSLAGLVCENVFAQLPADFPVFTVTKTENAAPGVYIGSLGSFWGAYNVILDNDGTVLWYSKTDKLSKFVESNGLIGVGNGGINGFDFKDETFAVVDSFSLIGEEYVLDSHDVELLPNGHCLVYGKESRRIDMSKFVPDGRPDAVVKGDVIQELDADKKLVFEWHSLDHMGFMDSFWGLHKASIDSVHMNYMVIDPLDNNLIASFRLTTDIVKINRSTGEIMWRLGGPQNDFTFIGEHEENAPYYFIGQHSSIRLLNGDIVFFDNGNIGVDSHDIDRTYSRAVKYHLDEVNMTATLVWEFRHSPDINARAQGNVWPLPNGNTLIWWGFGVRTSGVVCTEVTPSGEVASEVLSSNGTLIKKVWNSPDLITTETISNAQAGQTYDSAATGVSVTVNSLTDGGSGNELKINKHDDATRFARFATAGMAPDPALLVKRVTLESQEITALDADITFATADLESVDPSQLTVYHRPVAGQGEFTALATTYDQPTAALHVLGASLGEFVFGHPDVAEIAVAPTLMAPTDGSSVSDAEPTILKWQPNGFIRTYSIQVATDAEFSSLIVDETGLTDYRYTLATVDPNTTYYWRVSTINFGGTSDWAVGSFATVPPMITVPTPVDGQNLHRGLDYFIQWNDNIAEDVVIELYKGAAPVATVGTVSSEFAYRWEIPLSVDAGIGYSFKISSSTDPNLFGVSGSFSLDITTGDLNGDGTVDLADLGIFAENYLTGTP